MARPATRNLGRLSEIAQVLVRHGFGYMFERHRLTDILPWRERAAPLDGQPSSRGRALREALDELGPTFVKFGQLLSMRPDVLPPDIIAELRALQDDVRPFPFEQAEQVIEADLGLSLERLFLDGTQVADVDPTVVPIEDRRELAYRMTEAWMTMIFRHGFFHGDPHPANILLLERPGHIGLVDFGLAGKLTDEDMTKLTRLFIDAANENVDALPRRLADLGVRYPKDREDEFLAELRELYYRYYGATLAEIDPLQVIREAFNLIYTMNLRLPTRFLLLHKAIATLGSVGIELYPDFNVFEVAQPYARALMLDRFGPKRLVARARKESLKLAQVVTEMPYQLHDFLEEIRDGQIEVGFVHKGLEDLLNRLDVVFNRLVIAMIVAGGLIGSSLIGIFAKAGPHVLGINIISVLGFAFSGLLGMWLLWGVIRSGRL